MFILLNTNVYFCQLLDIVHPAARILTDIARSQDAEVGDGTTSVVVLAGEILKEVRDSVEQGVSTQTIIKGLRRAGAMAVNKIKEISIDMLEASGSEEKKIALMALYESARQVLNNGMKLLGLTPVERM